MCSEIAAEIEAEGLCLRSIMSSWKSKMFVSSNQEVVDGILLEKVESSELQHFTAPWHG